MDITWKMLDCVENSTITKDLSDVQVVPKKQTTDNT